MYKCKLCGATFENYTNEEFEEYGEEELWGHIQMNHEEAFKECEDWETATMIEEYYTITIMQKFETGRLVMTQGIAMDCSENEEFSKEIFTCLERYCNCDWGEMCEEDIEANNEALINGERLLGAYETSMGGIYIITEHDHSCTTLLYKYEY